MRRPQVLFLFIVVLCLFATVGRAGDGAQLANAPDSMVTLAQLVQQVLQNNPALQASRLRIQGAEARVSQATAWDDPQAGVEFYATPVTSANPFKDGMETDYFVQQMIPLGKKSPMEDAARANVLGLFNEDVKFEMFNVGTGIETSVNQLKDLIFAEMGRSVPVERLDYDKHLVRRRQASTEKIRGKLGFVPKVSVPEGLRRYVQALIGPGKGSHAV